MALCCIGIVVNPGVELVKPLCLGLPKLKALVSGLELQLFSR